MQKQRLTIYAIVVKKVMPALENIGKLTDINQETLVKEVVSALKPTRKKTTKVKTAN